MVRPKVGSVEGQRAALKRDSREVFDLRRRLPRLKACDAPIFVPLLGPAQDVEPSIDKHMATDFGSHIKNSQDIAVRIEPEDPMLVPLAQVEMTAIVAQV